MPTVAAELKKKINRPVSDLALADEAEGSLMLKVSATTTTSEGIASAAAAGHMIAASLTATIQNQKDAPPCPKCGHIAVRNGACYKCLNCGESLGCS
jgi:ribonucleoside-diphosphate reductase alpha chain